MKLAVSNIGWTSEQEPVVLDSARGWGVEGIVVAPTMMWPEAPRVDQARVRDFLARVQDAGLSIVGLQSLTFGLKDAQLSGDPTMTSRLAEHLKRQADLGGRLGATSLIFGSPGLRRGVDPRQAMDLFASVADSAHSAGTRLCIEPLTGYGNEYVRTVAEGVELVEGVDHPGLGLHLDAAAVAGEDPFEPERSFRGAMSRVGITSFDASAPELGPLTTDRSVDHRRIARALGSAGYDGFVSLEMRAVPGSGVDGYRQQVGFVKQQYGIE